MPPMMVWPVSSSVWPGRSGPPRPATARALPSLSWASLVLGSTATWMTGLREVERLEDDRVLLVAERVAGGVSFMPTTATMSPVKATSRSSWLLACIWRMRPTRSLRSLVVLSTRGALLERARVDAEVGELAHVRVGHDLEGQAGEGLVVVGGLALELLVALGVDARWPGGTSSGLGQEVHDGVEHGLDALVLERRAAQHGDDRGRRWCRRGWRRCSSSAVISSSPRYFSMMSSSWLATTSSSFVAPLVGLRRPARPGCRRRRSARRAWRPRPRRGPSC